MIKQWIVFFSLVVSFSLQPALAKSTFEKEMDNDYKSAEKVTNTDIHNLAHPEFKVPPEMK